MSTAVATPEKSLAQCHFISNTHWDREWRYSMQRTRHMLVYMLDMLLDILAREPEFKSFHMDSQTIPRQDYLEIRPERREQVVQLVQAGRLLIGPWFVLPDEFCVGGESLVRNLLLGHRQAKELGRVSALLKVRDVTQILASGLTEQAQAEIKAVIERHGDVWYRHNSATPVKCQREALLGGSNRRVGGKKI